MPATTRSEFTRTYNSFSGVDMLVMFGSQLIGELQGISYTITREKAPLYTMGSADPRSFSRGKRGIAGSLIFLVFDRNALLSSMLGTKSGVYLANEYETEEKRRLEAAPDVFKEVQASGSVGSAVVGDTDGARLVNTGITARKEREGAGKQPGTAASPDRKPKVLRTLDETSDKRPKTSAMSLDELE